MRCRNVRAITRIWVAETHTLYGPAPTPSPAATAALSYDRVATAQSYGDALTVSWGARGSTRLTRIEFEACLVPNSRHLVWAIDNLHPLRSPELLQCNTASDALKSTSTSSRMLSSRSITRNDLCRRTISNRSSAQSSNESFTQVSLARKRTFATAAGDASEKCICRDAVVRRRISK
jgi:hypothetical protein